MDAPTIVSASITAMPRPMPEGMFDPMPKVVATFADGRKVELFSYYPDELCFTPEEFVGLTEEQGRRLRYSKDVAYLRS